MADTKSVYLFFLMDDPAQIRACFEDGFAGALASLDETDGRLCLRTTDGAVVTAAPVPKSADNGKLYNETINEIWNRFRTAETTHHDVRANLLHQIRLYRALYVVDIVAAGKQKKTAHSGLLDTCCNGGGLLLNDEKTVFCDEDDHIVLSADGACDLAYYEVRELPLPEPAANAEALARRTRSRAQLARRHIYSPLWLPPLKERPAEGFPVCTAVAGRLIALTLTALHADGILAQHLSPAQARQFIKPYVTAYGADRFFSPQEQAYLDKLHPAQDVVIEYSWNYEHAWVLFWALGLTETLAFPDRVCDAAALAALVKTAGSLDALLARVNLRAGAELLDAADLYFRYNWAVLDVCGQMGLRAPAEMDPGVVSSREKALGWLTGLGEWDHVRTEL